MGKLEVDLKQGCRPPAVCIEVIQESHDNNDGKNRVQRDKEKIFDSGPFQACPVKPLKEKQGYMNNKKKGKDKHIRFYGWNAFFGIYRNDISVKTEPIRIKIRYQYPDNITEDIKTDEFGPILLYHFLS